LEAGSPGGLSKGFLSGKLSGAGGLVALLSKPESGCGAVLTIGPAAGSVFLSGVLTGVLSSGSDGFFAGTSLPLGTEPKSSGAFFSMEPLVGASGADLPKSSRLLGVSGPGLTGDPSLPVLVPPKLSVPFGDSGSNVLPVDLVDSPVSFTGGLLSESAPNLLGGGPKASWEIFSTADLSVLPAAEPVLSELVNLSGCSGPGIFVSLLARKCVGRLHLGIYPGSGKGKTESFYAGATRLRLFMMDPACWPIRMAGE
jgi:hypothetical protein